MPRFGVDGTLKPAEIEANGGKTPIAFNYADYSTIGVVSLRAYDVEWLAPVVVRR